MVKFVLLQFPRAAGWREWILKGQSCSVVAVVRMRGYQGPKSIVGVGSGRVGGSEPC